MAQRLGLPFLGAVPINMALRANGDAGEPTKNFDAETAGGDALPVGAHQGRGQPRVAGDARVAQAGQDDADADDQLIIAAGDLGARF
jgi:hypothetical protein